MSFLAGVDFTDCPEIPLFPLVHTSNSLDGKAYLETGKIPKPNKPCEAFPEDNPVYLFYGKPAYRETIELTSFNGSTPMVFIFKDDPNIRKNIIRMYPCDTGAHYGRIYEGYTIQKDWDFKRFKIDFEMGNDINLLPLHVVLFFGSNENYYNLEPAPMRKKIPLNNANNAFLELIESKKFEKFDDRCGVVEVQSEEIDTLLERLLFVFAPYSAISHNMKSKLDAKGITVELYEPAGQRTRFMEYYFKCFDAVREYYRSDDNKYLKAMKLK